MISSTTIAALATPHAAGGIARDPYFRQPRPLHRCRLLLSDINEVPRKPCAVIPAPMVRSSICPAPKLMTVSSPSFAHHIAITGEDVAELSCHGGIYVTERILDALYAAGAVPAEPGEFTKRAFLAGKNDAYTSRGPLWMSSAQQENGNSPSPMLSKREHCSIVSIGSNSRLCAV